MHTILASTRVLLLEYEYEKSLPHPVAQSAHRRVAYADRTKPITIIAHYSSLKIMHNYIRIPIIRAAYEKYVRPPQYSLLRTLA